MTESKKDWELTLEQELWGWLLPHSERRVLTPEAAASALTRLSGRPDHLALLRRASFLTRERASLTKFVFDLLPAFARALPSQTLVEERTWEGGFHGRLNIPATMALHNAGQPTRFVTRARRRDFALDENVFVVGVCVGLLQMLRRLSAETESCADWLDGAQGLADALERLLLTTVLKEIPQAPIEARHRQAAKGSRHGAARAAVPLWDSLQDALGFSAPERLAALLAKGALWPIREAKRFELAVLARLGAQLVAWAGKRPGWSVEQRIIKSDRDAVLKLSGPEGQTLSLLYDQGQAELSWRVEALRAYLGASSRPRPDISVLIERPGRPKRGVLIEVKHSDNADYIKAGFAEAIVYREEYDALFSEEKDWPKTILVTSHALLADPRAEDEVIAVDWRRWVPESVLEGIVSGL